MASRHPRRHEPPELEVKQFTVPEMDKAVDKLASRVKEVQELNPQKVRYDDAIVHTVESNISNTILEVFGSRSPEFLEHQFHRISHGRWQAGLGEDALQENFAAGIPQTVAMLQGLIARVEEKRADALPDTSAPASSAPLPRSGRGVFVVHGRDEEAKLAVARFLDKLDLQPIILHERPNQGRTLIEKFEKNAGDVGFAVVLLTPDDEGHLANRPEEAKPRPRQNVILELGYFIGRLGRPRVCALHRGGVELPSDLHGIVYIAWEDPQNWQILLAREIKAADIPVDLNRVI